MIKRFAGWTILIAACLGGPAMAADAPARDAVVVNPDHPSTYTVQSGDTLWGIAGRFLKNPWQWPEIWHVNEQVANPHLIYPGDVLRLTWQDGRPVLVVENGPTYAKDPVTGADVVRLRPQVRVLPLSEAIPAIPLRQVKAFLNDSRVATPGELEAAPYIVTGPDARTVMGQGDIAYGRDPVGRWSQSFPEYGVYRSGVQYQDPETGELLGLEARRVGGVRVAASEGDVATLSITSSAQELRSDDHLLHDDPRAIQPVFNPRPAPEGIGGRIVHIFGSLGYAARYDVVVINRGIREQVAPGHVFSVQQDPGPMRDRRRGDFINIPSTPSATLMVFRAFDRVSYALVMDSSRPVSRGDRVTEPALAF